MIITWVTVIGVVGGILVFMLRKHKNAEPKNDLHDFAESFNKQVFPMGKADHEEGAKMVHEIMAGIMPLAECRDVFIKAAIVAQMQSDVVAHLSLRYGDTMTADQRNSIAGYLAIRMLSIASGPDMVVRREPNGVISFGAE